MSHAEGQGAWGRPISARLGEVAAALALLASGLFFVWQAALLPFGRIGLPGPGFFPFALGVALGLLALSILAHAWWGANKNEVVFLGHRDVLIAVVALAGVALTFENVDAYVALGGFTALLLLLVARTAIWRAVLGVVLGMIAVWLFFRLALGVRLPTADLWDQIADYVTTLFVQQQQ